MSLQTEKLELVRLLLDTDNKEILQQIRNLLKHESNKETEYLLSEEVNQEHLEKGIQQASQGDYQSIDLDTLWN